MRPESWIEEVFGTRARVRVLRALTKDRRRYWTEREVAKAVKMSPSTVNATISELRDLRILESHTFGRSSVVRLREPLYVNDLIEDFFVREKSTWPKLEKQIERKLSHGIACYLYGSTARGSAASISDIDLFLVAPSETEAEAAAESVRRLLQQTLPARVEIVALSRKQFRSRFNTSLVRNVLREGRRLSRTTLEQLR